MAILENIRKRTTVLILIIGLALFAFVIQGIIDSDGSFGGGAKMGSAIAEVNGEPLSIDDFRATLERRKQQFGRGMSQTQLVNTVYDQEVRNAILAQQYDELGLNVGSDQIVDYVRQQGWASQVPEFADSEGNFNEDLFRNAILDWQETDPLRYQAWLEDEANITRQAKEQMYFNLIKSGLDATLTEGEFDYGLSNNKVNMEFVRVPYTAVADSTIQIGKGEIEKYVNEHKDEFEQEKARDIRFVFFEEKPSVADEQTAEARVAELKEAFKTTTELEAFLETEGSDTAYDTIYRPKSQLPSAAADTLLKLAVGDVYGPYRDAQSFKVSRVLAKKPEGSVKASHILFVYEGATRANPEIKRTKEEAKAEAEKILIEAQKADADFAELAKEHSDGPSAPRGGDLGFFQDNGTMVAEFSDFCFSNPVGAIDLVETEFGFHIIKIEEKQDLIQVTHLTANIEPSEKTTNDLYQEATQFEMEVKDADVSAFGDITKEKQYALRPVGGIKELEENLPGLGAQRAIVQWAFKEDTEVGDIERFSIPTGYAVVQLTKKLKKGVMTPEDASAKVLPILRKEAKAAQLIAKYKGKSMEEIAQEAGVSKSTVSAVTMKAPTLAGAGSEPAVVGAAFALETGQTSGLIEGETGIFMVKVTDKNEAIKLPNFTTFARTISNSNRARANSKAYQALKEASKIDDFRAEFY